MSKGSDLGPCSYARHQRAADVADHIVESKQFDSVVIFRYLFGFIMRHAVQGRRSENDFLLLKAASDVRCVILCDAEDYNQAVSAVEDGAQGFIPGSVSLQVAVQAVRLVETGGTFIPAQFVMLSQRATPIHEGNGDATGLFTVRQAAVLAALHQGCPISRSPISFICSYE